MTVDVPPGGSLEDIKLPGHAGHRRPRPPRPTTPAPEPEQTQEQTTPAPPPEPGPPSAGGGSPQGQHEQRRARAPRAREGPQGCIAGKPPAEDEGSDKKRKRGERSCARPTATPTSSNPGFIDALPGPSTAHGVPNFIIRKFRVPPFLLPIYQAAGIEYGIRWEILAAINEIETDYGRNLNVSSAGALGWMQFMPSTWRAYGTDANKDKRKDPYNPVDAIFAAARYLKAAGYEDDVRRAIFAYNHADWYVDSVLLRARLIAGVPADLIGSLTGLTEGRFPVYARARYADDLAEAELLKRVKQGENAANVIESADDRRSIDIYARSGSPVVAVNDGVIKEIGESERLGPLRDAAGRVRQPLHVRAPRLGRPSSTPCPRQHADDPDRAARAVKANGDDARSRLRPRRPRPAASSTTRTSEPAAEPKPAARTPRRACRSRSACSPTRTWRARARPAGSTSCSTPRRARTAPTRPTATTSRGPFGLDPKKVTLRRLRKGSRVIGGTIIGRVGRTVENRAAHLDFSIRPAGKGAPRIDPKPILDGWKLLEATAIYRASGRNVLHGDDVDGMSIGQILLLPKPQLERRVLADERIEIYDVRPRRHPLRPDRPARAGDARVPRRVRPAADRDQPQVRPRLLHELGQRLAPQLRQRGRHRQDQRHPDPGPPGGGRHHRAVACAG